MILDGRELKCIVEFILCFIYFYFFVPVQVFDCISVRFYYCIRVSWEFF